MELHTLGVDGGYTQKDVQEVARAFTGWTIDGPRQGGEFRFEPRMHDDGEKVVLGQRIAAGGGEATASRCSTSSRRTPRRRASSPPSLRGGSSRDDAAGGARRTRGRQIPRDERGHPRGRPHDRDLAGVLRGRGVSREGEDAVRVRRQRRARDRTPTSPMRCLLVQALRELGMPLYGCQPPTGYADRAEAWVNTGALAEPHELRAGADRRTPAAMRIDGEASCNGRGSRAEQRVADRDRARWRHLARDARDRRQGDHGTRRPAHSSSARRSFRKGRSGP